MLWSIRVFRYILGQAGLILSLAMFVVACVGLGFDCNEQPHLDCGLRATQPEIYQACAVWLKPKFTFTFTERGHIHVYIRIPVCRYGIVALTILSISAISTNGIVKGGGRPPSIGPDLPPAILAISATPASPRSSPLELDSVQLSET